MIVIIDIAIVSDKKRRWDVDILRRFIFDFLNNDIKNYLKNEKYKLLSDFDIHLNVSKNVFELFHQLRCIVIETNSTFRF